MSITQPKCWLIKTTEGGSKLHDHWDKFKSENVVAVGWDVKADPLLFDSLGEYRRHTKLSAHAASTIYKFAHGLKEGDTAIICRGIAPNQKQGVYVYGIARIGSCFFDKTSKWWHIKRDAFITPLEQTVPLSIFKTSLNIGSSMQTLQGPFSEKQITVFANKLGISLTPKHKISKSTQIADEVKSKTRAASHGGGFGSPANNKQIEKLLCVSYRAGIAQTAGKSQMLALNV